jgi:hypothetical protein
MGVLLDLGNDTVEVSYTASVYYPARLTGHPDSWAPAEGGEIEIEEVRYESPGHVLIDGKWVRFNRVRVDVIGLCTDHDIERFQEEIASIAEDDEP